MKKISYSASNILPAKLVRKGTDCVVDGKIVPFHPQISLTNKCNLSCSFCSCANVKLEEMPPAVAYSILVQLRDFGSKAITITGGGEPLLYKSLFDFVSLCKIFGIEVGLVTNGLLIGNVNSNIFSHVKWCRISASDASDIEKLFFSISETVEKYPLDWAFSYVVTEDYNIGNIVSVVEFANKFKFTHVRLVTDLLNMEKVVGLDVIKQALTEKGVDDSLVIYQGRKEFTKGTSKCLIPLLKPFIGTDGHVYPCCGIQYALKEQSLNFPPEMDMGVVNPSLWEDQVHFDGSICERCYYSSYNETLQLLTGKIEHENFI